MTPMEVKNICMSVGACLGCIYARATPEEKYQIRQEFSAQNIDDMFNAIDQQAVDAQQQQEQQQQPLY